MKLTTLLAGAFILISGLSLYAQTPDWYIKLKQVKPVESTKTDVEKNFGVADKTRVIDGSTRIFSSYYLTDGWLTITYSNGKCQPNQDFGYDILKETVETVYFTAKKPVKLSFLRVNLKGFYSSWVSDVPVQIYTNYTTGIEYSVSRKSVRSVKLFPAAKYDNLRCEKKQ
jgi:hypothetical protein